MIKVHKNIQSKLAKVYKSVLFIKMQLIFILTYGILFTWETRELKTAALFFGGTNPPNERKESVANDDYIF